MLFKHFLQDREIAKAFIYLKSLKTVCGEVNLLWSCEMPTWTLWKKAPSHILLHAFCLHFLRIHTLFPKRLWKCASRISFWKCKRKLVIYLFYNDSSKSTFFMLNCGFWRSLEYSFYQIKWNSSFLAIL